MDKFLAENRVSRHNDTLLIKGGKYENKQKDIFVYGIVGSSCAGVVACRV